LADLSPELCVPALSNCVLSTKYRVRRNSIQALGEFGSAAMPALDVVSNAMFDSDSHIRGVATNAVRKIAPDVPGMNGVGRQD
jgi:HEAT repeat protein